ncbi:hypothetical protein UlMin_026233 [Ulmus minor]
MKEVSIARTNTPNLLSSRSCSSLANTNRHRINVSLPPKNGGIRARLWLEEERSWRRRGDLERRGSAMAVECGNPGSESVVDVAAEEMSPEEAADWMEFGRLREKCGEGRGMVEVLECLEREAIMGEDEGKEPSDYNRRAKIFDKSSRVFQALKERSDGVNINQQT